MINEEMTRNERESGFLQLVTYGPVDYPTGEELEKIIQLMKACENRTETSCCIIL